jgi:hypothetical protein
MLSFAIFSHISLLRPVSASRRDLYTLLLTFMLGTVGYTEAGKLPSPWQGLVKGAIVLSYAFLAAWLHWPLLRLETVRHEPFQNPPIGPSQLGVDDDDVLPPMPDMFDLYENPWVLP